MDQQSWITLVSGLVAGLGIGSVVTALIQHGLRLKEVAHESQRKDLEARYKVIILLMYAAHDFKSNETTFRIHRPDIKSREGVLDELQAEWVNMLLFASKSTLNALHLFITESSSNNLLKCAISMRLDLGRDSLQLKDLTLNLSPNKSFNRTPPHKEGLLSL